jgi:nicotinamidase-related amidase
LSIARNTAGMPVTAINPACALVVIDIQKGIVAQPAAHPVAGVIENVVRLVDAFRTHARPVVLVRVGWSKGRGDAIETRVQHSGPTGDLPPGFIEYVEALRPDPEHDILILKHQWGAFYGTELELQLRRRGITDVVLCGVSTSIGVESTARNANELGFNLTFASDAMTDRDGAAHDRAIDLIFPRIGEIGTTDEILAKLA